MALCTHFARLDAIDSGLPANCLNVILHDLINARPGRFIGSPEQHLGSYAHEKE
jgi:hypothetical protein